MVSCGINMYVQYYCIITFVTSYSLLVLCGFLDITSYFLLVLWISLLTSC